MSARPDDEPSVKKDGAEIIRLQHRTAYTQRAGDPDHISEEITLVCCKGRLHASGRYRGSSLHIEMLPSDWKNPDPILWKTRHIVFGQDSDDDGAIAGSYCPGYTRPDWRDLRFSVSDALENWPGPDRLAASSTPIRKATALSETECKQWLISLMTIGNSTQPKAQYFEEAVDRYGVSRRGFDRAWSNAVAESGKSDWSRPGRKS